MNGHKTMRGNGCSETSPTSRRTSRNPEGGAARNARVSAVATIAAAVKHDRRRQPREDGARARLRRAIRARASDTPVK